MLFKYPRTPHLPWSLGRTEDDIECSAPFSTLPTTVVVTEKMDGENTTLYRNHIHARSLDSRHHISRNWVKNFWNDLKQDIPEGWRVCGENVYSRHSIVYDDLESFFYGFSIWDDTNTCLSWEETLEWFSLLNITPVSCLYVGPYGEEQLRALAKTMDLDRSEGYVVRSALSFHYNKFSENVAKFVRPNHVKTDKHWQHSECVQNKIRG